MRSISLIRKLKYTEKAGVAIADSWLLHCSPYIKQYHNECYKRHTSAELQKLNYVKILFREIY